MSFRVESVRGAADSAAPAAEIDYRLARNAVVKELRRGRLSRLDVCDAHPELLRAAGSIGVPKDEVCPVCQDGPLVHVSYAFGARLSPGGHSFASGSELAKLVRRTGDVTCYVVEVCPACSWNHLVRTFAAGRRRRSVSAT